MINNIDQVKNLIERKKRDRIKFNLSASSLSMYEKSPLTFFFKYIIKAQPDTEVVGVYGDAGNVIHELLQELIEERNTQKKIIEFISVEDLKRENDIEFIKKRYSVKFKEKWEGYGLYEGVGFNNQVLDVEDYLLCLNRGIEYVVNNPNITIAEYNFSFPMVQNEKVDINVKGFIDAVNIKDNVVHDWKTNNKKEDFSLAAKMYCYAYWKEYKIIPVAIYHYLKLDKKDSYQFSEQEMIDFEEYLYGIAREIIGKGYNIDEYKEGSYDGMFNEYYNSCAMIAQQREDDRDKVPIKYNVYANHIKLVGVPEVLNKMIDLRFSYFTKGHEFSPAFQSKKWDGKVHCYNKDSKVLPLGLLSTLEGFVEDYGVKYPGTKYKMVKNIDTRKDFGPLNKNFKETDFEVRYYQQEAIDRAMDKKIGILNLGTGAGKTLIASEIIKRVNRKTLVLINRIELVVQTADVFEEELGIEVGRMIEGELNSNIDKDIIVASVQTIKAIMNRKNEDTKKCMELLYRINVLIYDECHTVKDAGMYKDVARALPNALYIIGLTGTAFRNDEHKMRMNALVGDVIYSKTTKELADEGFISKTKCYFYKISKCLLDNDNYHSAYDKYIVQNEERNEKVKMIVDKNPRAKILILTKLIAHGELLRNLIPNSRLITSDTSSEKRRVDFEDFKKSRYNVLIGSVQIFSTGINLPDLDILINVSGSKTTVGTIQSIGRVMRKSEGKSYGYYIDFYDSGNKYFIEATQQRMDILEEFGHKIEIL